MILHNSKYISIQHVMKSSKHIAIIVVFIMLCTQTYAQSISKVIFIRKERAISLYRHAFLFIYDNNKRVELLRSHDFGVYTNTNSSSIIYAKPTAALSDEYMRSNELKLNIAPNSVTFVGINMKPRILYGIKIKLTPMSIAEFTTYYNKKRWLRKRLLKAGYKSISEIVDSGVRDK